MDTAKILRRYKNGELTQSDTEFVKKWEKKFESIITEFVERRGTASIVNVFMVFENENMTTRYQTLI